MTASPTRSLLAFAFVVVACAPVAARDRPVSGEKLVVVRRGSTEKLVFVSKDAALLFPAVGSADDPGTGTPGGAFVEVLSAAEGTASFSVPSGQGAPGWKAKGASVHVFKNNAAPGGISSLKKLVVKDGRLLKVIAKEVGLSLAAPAGRVAVRVTMGSLRNCAVFDGASVIHDEADRFEAERAPLPAISDCSDASLLGIPLVCGESAPACGGTCPSGEACASIGLPSPDNTCVCLPAGSTPCGTPGAPVCGGACPTGQTCNAFFPPLSLGGGDVYCNCAGAGTRCGNGFAWGGAPLEGFPFACYPWLCSGTYPTCGSSCGDGGTCEAFSFDVASFRTCLCAAPGLCEPGGTGYECPPGEVCHVSPGDDYPFCGAP